MSNNKLLLEDIASFAELYKYTLYMEDIYNADITSRTSKRIELEELYSRLDEMATQMKKHLESSKKKYSSQIQHSNVVGYDSNRFLDLVHSLLDSKDNYDVEVFKYQAMGADDEYYEDVLTVLSTKEGIELLSLDGGRYLFQKINTLAKLRDLNIPFVVMGNDIFKSTFDDKVQSISVRNIGYLSTRIYECCYEPDDEIRNALDRIKSFVEKYGSDLTGIDDGELVHLISNTDEVKRYRKGTNNPPFIVDPKRDNY